MEFFIILLPDLERGLIKHVQWEVRLAYTPGVYACL